MKKNNRHLIGFLRDSGLYAWERKFFITLLCVLFSVFQIIPSALAVNSSNSPIMSAVCSSAGISTVQSDGSSEKAPNSGSMCKFCPTTTSNNSGLVPFVEKIVVDNYFVAAFNKSQLVGDIALGARHRAISRGPPIAEIKPKDPLLITKNNILVFSENLKGLVL